jgi:CheY-like chemotaxis protein
MAQQVLVVDDNEVVRWTLQARLGVAGFEVTAVASAAEALKALAAGRFDLVLLDYDMPQMTGLEALAQIEQRGLCPRTPIVLLTSSEEFELVRAARSGGARGYLTKAEAFRNLMPALTRLLGGRSDVTWIDDFHTVSVAGR